MGREQLRGPPIAPASARSQQLAPTNAEQGPYGSMPEWQFHVAIAPIRLSSTEENIRLVAISER
jgi:hypothetical protein